MPPGEAIMFRRDEENCVSGLYPLPKFSPCRRRILIPILVVDGQVPDIDDAELQCPGGKFGKRVRHFPVD
jgi:hypothetical protein